jgi:hypothetical protein
MSNELTQTQYSDQPRSLAISAGHLSAAVSAELGRLLVKNGGDRRKAVAAGFAELTSRKTISAKEGSELAAIMEMFFAAPDGQDSKLAKRANDYFHALILDNGSSPAALAICSVITSLTSASKVPAGASPTQGAVSKGDAVFGGTGAVIGAGIGFGIGGPIGAGVGAVVGAAVGVCIERG